MASSTSLVTRITVERRAFQILSSSSWSVARVSASSALKGSSIRRSLGFMAIPRALDALTRATLQDELLKIWNARRSTVILVTNDVDEAILLADRIYPMTPGPGAI